MKTSNRHIPIITVTGTKGKTTVVGFVSAVLQALRYTVLHVDTSGHFINGERRSSQADSLKRWGIRTVTAAPGRYLNELEDEAISAKGAVAVLEASFSSAKTGLGYDAHKVGVFLNVFEDHINPQGAIKSRRDLAEAKSFVFSAIQPGGFAVFNADDDMVCAMLGSIPEDAVIIPCGRTFAYFNLAAHRAAGGGYITLKDDKVVYVRGAHEIILCDLKRMKGALYGQYAPLAENIMYACGALVGYFDGKVPDGLREVIEAASLPEETGRLVVLKAKSGATVITDYAHEKVSLRAVAALGRNMLSPNRKGALRIVARLSHERPEEDIRQTGEVIGEAFDDVIIYDKIDGYFRQPRPPFKKAYPQVVGRVSTLLSEGAKTVNRRVTRIIREDEAIRHAVAVTKAEDVVVVILNDDVERSMQFVRNAFKVDS